MEADGKTFKKATQEVNRPAVTDHDMHEDFMKNPPRVRPRCDPHIEISS